VKIGGTSSNGGFKIGPTVGDYALDVAKLGQGADYARFLALLAAQQNAVINNRLVSLEPEAVVSNPVVSISYVSFPSVEDFDAVFSDTPVVQLNTAEGVALTDYSTTTVIDVTHRPYMDRAWMGAVGTAATTYSSLFAGSANTAALEVTAPVWGSLPRIVRSLTFGSFSDWSIPSEDELVEIYNNLAEFTELPADIVSGLVARLSSSTEGADDAVNIVTVSVVDGTTLDVPKLNQTTAEAGALQYGVVPVRYFSSETAAVGDIGEGGGVVFFVDLCAQKGYSGAKGVVVGTADGIGTGPSNQTAWTTEVTDPLAHCNMVASLDINGRNDWFIPSHDELIEIYNNLSDFPILDAAVTAATLDVVASSSEADSPDNDDLLKTVEFSTGLDTNTVLKYDLAGIDGGGSQGAVIPVRAIFSTAGAFSIGDTGPGGGVVFYDNGSDASWGRYLEALDGWYRCIEAIDAEQGSWYYDLDEYNTFDADERFYPVGALDVYPYDGTGILQVYPQAGLCTYSDVGIASTLFYVDEAVLPMQARTVATGLVALVQLVVLSTLGAP